MSRKKVSIGEHIWIEVNDCDNRIEYLFGIKNLTDESKPYAHIIFYDGKEIGFRDAKDISTQKFDGGSFTIQCPKEDYGCTELLCTTNGKLMVRALFGTASFSTRNGHYTTTNTIFSELKL